MSKTSETNSDKQKVGFLSKPLKELATDLLLKFRRDVFFSTRAKIILFHTLSIVVIIFITIWLIEFVQQRTLTAVVGVVEESLSIGGLHTDYLTAATKQIESTMWYIFAVIVTTSLITGIIVSRVALQPVRDALALQKRFIASIAHELRTPLAILKTQNEVAKLDVDPDSEVARTLNDNVEEINHITRILNSLLLFNRVDTLESISFDQVSIGAIIDTVQTRVNTFAERQGVRLYRAPGEIPAVYGSETAIEQALFNLVKNALNYTRKGGEVWIECISVTPHDVTISIRDNGIGIAKKDLPHIFEPFYRTRSGREEGRGSGLGLALVFEIMKLHNGRIHVHSTEGEGTEFLLTFPRVHSRLLQRTETVSDGITHDFSREIAQT